MRRNTTEGRVGAPPEPKEPASQPGDQAAAARPPSERPTKRARKRLERPTPKPQATTTPMPAVLDDDILDWGVLVESPPPMPTSTIRMRFVPGGYRRPRIVEDGE
jgi:hypothetical protein